MTTTTTGRPRCYDEDELVERIGGFADLGLIEAALVEHSSRPTWARGCVDWLWRRKVDPTGGRSSKQASRYRAMLAELPYDPLRPPGGRRRALKALEGSNLADLRLIAGGASTRGSNRRSEGPRTPLALMRADPAPIDPLRAPGPLPVLGAAITAPNPPRAGERLAPAA